VPLKDAAGIERCMKVTASYFQEHPEKLLELFCYDCKTITCVTCYFGKHKTHECSDVKQAAEKFGEQLKSDIDNVSECALECRKNLTAVEEKKKNFVENVEATRIEISTLLEELNSLKSKGLKEIECWKDEVEKQLMIMEIFKIYSQEIKDKGTACLLSHFAHELHVRAEEIVKSQVDLNCLNREEFDIGSSFAGKVGANNFIAEFILNGRFNYNLCMFCFVIKRKHKVVQN